MLVKPAHVLLELFLRAIVDHRPDIGGKVARIADLQCRHRARNHRNHRIGDILLNE